MKRVRLGVLLLMLSVAGLAVWWASTSQRVAPDAYTNSDSASVVHGADATVASSASADISPLEFEDVTSRTGIRFSSRNGEEAEHYSILESLGSGVALFDFDNDGRLDIFVAGGGWFTGPTRQTITGLYGKLYRNLGDWKFVDVTAEVGLVGDFYTHGAFVCDFDRDGDADLLLTGYTGVRLFRNDAQADGRRRFVDVTARSGLSSHRAWATAAAWGDLDGDGWPDLYVCNYVDWSWTNDPFCPRAGGMGRDVCPPQRLPPLPDRVYRNQGDGTFIDCSETWGLRQDGKGLGVLMIDVDDDTIPEIYVANDGGDNFLYRVRRQANGAIRLEEIGLSAGVALDDRGIYNGSMGVDAADVDGSGRPSLWVTNFQNETHALYLNLGQLRFLHQTRAFGISALGQNLVGFGTAFLDADGDGWEDLLIAHGHVLRYPQGSSLAQRMVLLRNEATRGGRRRFVDWSQRAGAVFAPLQRGQGLAIGDLDQDGRVDVVLNPVNEPVQVWRNLRPTSTANTLGVLLQGQDRRCLVGAKVELQFTDRVQTRWVKSGASYLSSNEECLRFAWHGADPQAIRVTWPGGRIERWASPRSPAGGVLRLHEGSGETVEAPHTLNGGR